MHNIITVINAAFVSIFPDLSLGVDENVEST